MTHTGTDIAAAPEAPAAGPPQPPVPGGRAMPPRPPHPANTLPASTLHELGLLAHQRGDNQTAADLIRQAIAIAPRTAAFHGSLGVVLLGLRRAPGSRGRAAHRRSPAPQRCRRPRLPRRRPGRAGRLRRRRQGSRSDAAPASRRPGGPAHARRLPGESRPVRTSAGGIGRGHPRRPGQLHGAAVPSRPAARHGTHAGGIGRVRSGDPAVSRRPPGAPGPDPVDALSAGCDDAGHRQHRPAPGSGRGFPVAVPIHRFGPIARPAAPDRLRLRRFPQPSRRLLPARRAGRARQGGRRGVLLQQHGGRGPDDRPAETASRPLAADLRPGR